MLISGWLFECLSYLLGNSKFGECIHLEYHQEVDFLHANPLVDFHGANQEVFVVQLLLMLSSSPNFVNTKLIYILLFRLFAVVICALILQ